MKTLKQLAYHVIQFQLKEVLFIGIMTGAPFVIVFSNPWIWGSSLSGTFIAAMIKNYKQSKS